MIRGIVSAVPANIVRNDDEKFIVMTGVRERRIALPGQDVVTLGVAAAAQLMESTEWKADSIEALIVVTQTPTVRMPCMAAIIAGKLGITGAAFDINQACAGYVYGLAVARKMKVRTILIAGDTVSRMCDPDDKSTYPLFGDAVTASAIEPTDDWVKFQLGTDGSGAESLIADPTIRMKGADVMAFALRRVPQMVHDVTMNGNVDWLFYHQANEFLLKQVIRKTAYPLSKCPINIGKYGNTSSASIPLLMCDSESTELLKCRKQRVALFGFGAGLSYAGAMFDMEPLKVATGIEI